MIAKVAGMGQMLSTGAYALGPALAGCLAQHLQIRDVIFILGGIMMLLTSISLPSLFTRQMAEVRSLPKKTCLCESCKDKPLAPELSELQRSSTEVA